MPLNNLIVSYELLIPAANESAVIATLKQIGTCTRLRYSLWHVKSSHGAAQAAEKLRNILQGQDNVIVIDANNGNAAWYNVDPKVSSTLQSQWNRR